MFWSKKMPNAVLHRYKKMDGSYAYSDLVRTYVKENRRWCDFRGSPLLLRDDGSVVGDPDACAWELI